MYKILLQIYFALRNTNSNSEKYLTRSNFSFAVYFLDKKPPSIIYVIYPYVLLF